MNETIKNILERRAIRAYKPEQISPDLLDEILNAGLYAPSGMGMQSPITVAVQDKETISELSRMNAAVMGVDADPFYGAPTLLVVFAESTRRTYVEDGSLCIGTMMLAAHSLGVASCWIHRAREVFSTDEGKAYMRKWGVDEKYTGVGFVILGYSARPAEAKPRREGRIIKA